MAESAIQTLIDEFAKLPGIGRVSAERLAYHILKVKRDEALALSRAIEEVRTRLKPCSICFHIGEQDPCAICGDPRRDRNTICVVEHPKDLFALEKTGDYRGLYHVLQGRIAPMESVGPEDLTVEALVRRVQKGKVSEVILATNPDMEGDHTALYLSERLKQSAPGVRLTRIARGIPSGSNIEYASKSVLGDALRGRTAVEA